MDPMSIVLPILIVALIVLVVVIVLLVMKLMKTVEIANNAMNDAMAELKPTLENVKVMTDDLTPVMKKVDPLVDRVTLTVDAVNLEMMRVDEILEDVTEITDKAASATDAVEHIASAPAKAVNGVATRVRESFGTKDASDEPAQLGDQRAAVMEALEEYRAADALEESESAAAPESKPVYAEEPAAEFDENGQPQHSTTVPAEGYQVIDPNALQSSPFFDEETDEQE